MEETERTGDIKYIRPSQMRMSDDVAKAPQSELDCFQALPTLIQGRGEYRFAQSQDRNERGLKGR